MFKSAEENAKMRLVYSEKPSQFKKKQALLGNMRTSLLQLSGQAPASPEEDMQESFGLETSHDLVEALISGKNATRSDATGSLQLKNQAEVFRDIVKLGNELTHGAISQAGALSEEEADPLSSVNMVKVPWLAAVKYAEDNFTAEAEFNETAFDDWLSQRMGVRSTYVTRSPEEGQANPLGVLVAEEDINKGEAVLEMPLKCMLNLLSIRNRRIKSGFLGERLKEAFQHNQEWGLALVLLHEQNQHLYGDGSKWGPFIDTLRMRLLGTEIIQELVGTFAGELLRIEDDEVDAGYAWISKNVCKTDSTGMCSRRGERVQSGVYTREDFRWALSVVKQNAVPVKLATTGREYLSLVPLLNLAVHDPDAGGEIVLGLNNVAKFHVGDDVSAFHPVKMTKGPFTDSETFSRYHAVSEQLNRFNSVRMKIPGAGASEEDLIHKVQTLRDWRKAVGLPPRSSDLWRAASQLNLYGEDEEEQKYMDRQNRLVSGTNLEPITREEELMLTGKAKTSEQAALMIKPASNSEVMEEKFTESQLYSAPDLEDDVSLQTAAKNLKEAAHQLHISTALNLTKEGSVGKVLNETRNFFLYGTAPAKGLDAIDEMLIRKMDLMDSCGQPQEFVIRAENVSEELLCALRVTFSNETELTLIESNFNMSKAITHTNELLMLRFLQKSLVELLQMHPTSLEDDEVKLDSDQLSMKKRFAITLRVREKKLLHSALSSLDDKIEELDEESHELYQIAALLQEEKERQHRLDDLKQKLKEETEKLNNRTEVVTVTVNVRKAGQGNSVESVNLTILEGDSLNDKVSEFAIRYGLDQGARNQLENHVKNSVPEDRPITAMLQTITRYGTIAVLGTRQGENVTDKVERFLLAQGVLDESEDKFKDLLVSLEEKLSSRLAARFILQIPVVAPDGRKLSVHVRDGEQHDMVAFMKTFAQVSPCETSNVGLLLLMLKLLTLLFYYFEKQSR